MAWNEPGNQDPWDGQRRPGGKNQGPPDLDEVFGKLLNKLNGLFSSSNSKGSSGSGNQNGAHDILNTKLILAALLVGTFFWAAFGFYTVDQQERAVVLRLGKYLETMHPGLQWNPPLLDDVTKVNVTQVRTHDHRSLMLTEDENIVEVGLSVQYVISNPKDFLLEVRNPENSLAQATESALRHVVGSSEMHPILSEGRAILGDDVQNRLQGYLDVYNTGLEVSQVNIEKTSAPSQVQDAFDDVIKAREDEQRAKNEAETYANGVVPEARGQAQRVLEEAAAYREEVIAHAEGESNRFLKLLNEYKKAPQVTRERLYLVAMEDVLANSAKVLVDVEGGNNMMVLPLEQIMQKQVLRQSGLAGNVDGSQISRIADQVLEELTQRQNRLPNREGR